MLRTCREIIDAQNARRHLVYVKAKELHDLMVGSGLTKAEQIEVLGDVKDRVYELPDEDEED